METAHSLCRRFRTVQNSGVVWGLGTDAGVVAPYPPMLSLWWAVTGMDLGGERALSEAETVSRKERAYRPYEIERIPVFQGKRAGFHRKRQTGGPRRARPRLHDDTCEEQIKDIKPLLTMVGG